MSKQSSPKPVEELSYEEAFAELETIVNVLEGEQNPLDEAMSLFERGQVRSDCSRAARAIGLNTPAGAAHPGTAASQPTATEAGRAPSVSRRSPMVCVAAMRPA